MKNAQVERRLLDIGFELLQDADRMRVDDPILARQIYAQGRDMLIGSGRFTVSTLPATLPRSVSLVPVSKPEEPDWDAPTERLWELLQLVRDDLDTRWEAPPARRAGLLGSWFRSAWAWLWGERDGLAYV